MPDGSNSKFGFANLTTVPKDRETQANRAIVTHIHNEPQTELCRRDRRTWQAGSSSKACRPI